MDSSITEWLNLILRWIHVTAAIAWIGSSFFFMWLDAHIRRSKSAKPGVEGELWLVHGGGFYAIDKIMVAPAELPAELHWFKWEAALTWISGMALLILLYWLNASGLALDETVLSPAAALAVAIGTLLVAWVVYDGIWRSPLGDREGLATAICVLLAIGATYALCRLFNGQAAYFHIGAMLGTIMTANVWMIIIPGQRRLVAAAREHRPPDPRDGLAGKRRSTHNNYMTLPVLFIMLSTHFPTFYAHQYAWLVLVLISAAGAGTRYYFNLRHKGSHQPWILVVAALAMVALFFFVEN